jgi:hypothetical protein
LAAARQSEQPTRDEQRASDRARGDYISNKDFTSRPARSALTDVAVRDSSRTSTQVGYSAARIWKALSGAGSETSGPRSVQARQLIDENLQGLSSCGLMTVIYPRS